MKKKNLVAYREGNVIYPQAFLKKIYNENWEQLRGYLDEKREILKDELKGGRLEFPF